VGRLERVVDWDVVVVVVVVVAGMEAVDGVVDGPDGMVVFLLVVFLDVLISNQDDRRQSVRLLSS
jgi:hypothetical protein